MSAIYGSDVPLLDARLFGHDIVYNAPAGVTTDFTFQFPFNCKFNGSEILTDANAVLGDTITFLTEYDAGPFGWKRYKKISKCWHLMPSDRTRIILFPTDPTTSTRVKIQYKSTGLNAVNFCINFFCFIEETDVDPNQLHEGEDW